VAKRQVAPGLRTRPVDAEHRPVIIELPIPQRRKLRAHDEVVFAVAMSQSVRRASLRSGLVPILEAGDSHGAGNITVGIESGAGNRSQPRLHERDVAVTSPAIEPWAVYTAAWAIERNNAAATTTSNRARVMGKGGGWMRVEC
jgi:hypothetical protein